MSLIRARWLRSALLVAILVVVACPAVAGAATPVPPPASPRPAGCPPDPVTLEALIGLRLEGGPLADRYGARLNERALACFGSTELTFAAFVASPEGLGGTVAYILEPGWLDTWSSVDAHLAASDHAAAPGVPEGPFLPIAVPPPVRAAFDALRGQWVTASGQFDAPAARSCLIRRGGVFGAVIPTPADVVEMCRTSFVLSSFEPAANPCPAEDNLKAIVATPEPLRADCFAGRELSFVAVGYSVQNVWPGVTLPPGLGDWFLGIEGQEATLPVFVLQSVPLPDPAGTPWRDREGIGGSDVRWHVSGHFDDPLARTCLPAPGDTMDGVPVVKSLAEVQAFCRNHFVVDGLTWLPGDAAATTSPVGAEPTAATDVPAPADTRPDATLILLVTIAAAALVLLIAVLVARARGGGTLGGPHLP